VIGLGEMGLPMGANLVARGFDVAGYDLRQEACQALAALGGKIARSAGDAVREQQAVVVMVRTPAQAEQVVLGEDGVLARARPGTTLIVMSTVGVACMRRLGGSGRE